MFSFNRLANSLSQLATRSGLDIRGKLVLLFILLKVIPLLILATLAWQQINHLGESMSGYFLHQEHQSINLLSSIGDIAVNDSVEALNERARHDIERISTDTAISIARFLYARDSDIHLAAALPNDIRFYQSFMNSRVSPLPLRQQQWHLAENQQEWITDDHPVFTDVPEFTATISQNELHSRPPEIINQTAMQPLYREMTFVNLNGQERLKILDTGTSSSDLRDISQRINTFAHAETYFSELAGLADNEIYVSSVIGSYVGSKVVGTYTPAAAAKAGTVFDPVGSAYAGRENPLGKRFKGIVRWIKPVLQNGKRIGYVTLALNHDHLMAFTDHIIPTADRYTHIADASNGNYAFIWDNKGRNIAHPRHYYITGYNPETGDTEAPWLCEDSWQEWQNSGLGFSEFARSLPEYASQTNQHPPSKRQLELGQLGLDCRYLDFAPQCTGWRDLTANGGSGSFSILWSGLWKLNTAAAIPYFTGQYGHSLRGFGIVTIGANVDEFHRPAEDTRHAIDQQIRDARSAITARIAELNREIVATRTETAASLSLSTILMAVISILIAIWMAYYLSSHIRNLMQGISRFQDGDRSFRFHSQDKDEIGHLADTFDSMADHIQNNIRNLENEIRQRQQTEMLLRKMQDQLEMLVDERTAALSASNAELQVQIEERRQAERRVRHLAEHDPLTGLANRLRFQRQLDNALRQAHISGKKVALLYFDLDRFKPVNDTLGHSMGDKLLCHVATLLRKEVRSDDTVARLGGDEFAIIMGELTGVETAARVANSIVSQLRQPIKIDEYLINTGTSVGISIFPDDARDSGSLTIHADQAMYNAKSSGGNRYRVFTGSV